MKVYVKNFDGLEYAPLEVEGGTMGDDLIELDSVTFKCRPTTRAKKLYARSRDGSAKFRFFQVVLAPDGTANDDMLYTITKVEWSNMSDPDSPIVFTAKNYVRWVMEDCAYVPNRYKIADVNLDPEAPPSWNPPKDITALELFNHVGHAGQYIRKMHAWWSSDKNSMMNNIRIVGVNRIGKRDSAGNKWKGKQEVSIPFDVSWWQALQILRQANLLDYYTKGNRLFVVNFNSKGVNRTGGSNPIKFSANNSQEMPVRVDVTKLATKITVRGPGNRKETAQLTRAALRRLFPSDANPRHIEKVISRGDIVGDGTDENQVKLLKAVAVQELENVRRSAVERTFRTIIEKDRYRPGDGVEIGDKVLVLDINDDGDWAYVSHRLVSYRWQWGVDAQGGAESADWTFGRRMYDRIVNVFRRMKDVDMQIANSGLGKNNNDDPFYDRTTGYNWKDYVGDDGTQEEGHVRTWRDGAPVWAPPQGGSGGGGEIGGEKFTLDMTGTGSTIINMGSHNWLSYSTWLRAYGSSDSLTIRYSVDSVNWSEPVPIYATIVGVAHIEPLQLVGVKYVEFAHNGSFLLNGLML